jgi:hypothetical protein
MEGANPIKLENSLVTVYWRRWAKISRVIIIIWPTINALV